MDLEKFEYTKVIVPLGYERSGSGLLGIKEMVAEPVNIKQSDDAWVRINDLGMQGWEIVDTVPLTSSMANDVTNVVMVYTGGYVVILRRRK